jgi:putative heme-binding domain-containing protein
VGEVDLGSTGLSGLAQSEDREGGFPPDWQARMLIANAVTGAINSVTAEPKPEGGWKVARGPDLVTCKDRRFRPVHIAFGPDACLYIVDWYNPVISHNEVPRDHPARDKVSGRIWRVRHATQTKREAPNLQTARDTELVQQLQSPNTWEMRAAWREIVERKATGLIPALKALLQNDKLPDDVRIHALWCLAEFRHFDNALWMEVLLQRSGTDPNHLRPTSEELSTELVRSLRTIQPTQRESRKFQTLIGDQSSLRVRTEFARWLHDAQDISGRELAIALRWLKEAPAAKVKGVQGETLSWADYPQAFLNLWIGRAIERQKETVEQLAQAPGILARIPGSARVMIERAGYTKRFESGSVTLEEMEAEPVRSAALACAETSDKAAALLREYAAKSSHPFSLMEELLNSESLTPAALRRFAGPLALHAMAGKDAAAWPVAIDLAAHACTEADSAEFVKSARAILQAQPALLLPAVRAALSAGIRDVVFYRDIAGDKSASPAARAAAWTGWFESGNKYEKPKFEAALRMWSEEIPADANTAVLNELAATTLGTHFALNNVFPALLAQDATILPRLADELSERVPAHGRLPQVQEIVNRQRKARTEENAKRIAAVEKLTGDKAAGEPIFTSLCLTCHSAGGKGIGFAPPLDGSSKRDLPAVLLAMLEPEAAVENVFRPFHIRMRDGTEIEGFLKARSGNRAAIQLMGGAIQDVNLLRAHTARYRNGHSAMPPLAASLTDQQIADVAAFVRGL